MTLNSPIPDDPLRFIKACVEGRKILWTYHVNLRMKAKFIQRRFVVDSTNSYEIIEAYPDDKYMPSYLVYSRYQDNIFHVLFAVDLKGDNVRIVTAYRPALDEWEEDLKTRRMLK